MRHSSPFQRIALAIGLVSALGAVTAFGVAPLSELELPAQRRVTLPVALSIEAPEPIDRVLQVETLRRGDTLAQVLERAGANDPEFLHFAATHPTARKTLEMRPGRSVQLETDVLGRVLRFTYRPGDLDSAGGEKAAAPTRVEIRREGERLFATEQALPLERTVEMRSIEIEGSLFQATDAADVPENIAVKVAEIFAGEVDFSRELRKGDRLRIVYESLREQGSLDAPRAGRVLAVELINRGRRHEAFWYERAGRGEYFTFDGRSLEKAFLRNPLEYSRLISGFSDQRLHPIHQDWRAHRGVDLYAPAGTPVRAAADGVVESVGSQRGYGNLVVVRHHGPYSTLYAHLRDFAGGLRAGGTVRRGEVIGSVGATGWATGPHLHYEVKVNGEQVDPMTIALPEGRPLEAADRSRFLAKIGTVRDQFTRLDALRLARFE